VKLITMLIFLECISKQVLMPIKAISTIRKIYISVSNDFHMTYLIQVHKNFHYAFLLTLHVSSKIIDWLPSEADNYSPVMKFTAFMEP
jgi:hypothetical protein